MGNWRAMRRDGIPGSGAGHRHLEHNDFPLIDDNGNELTSEKDPGCVDVKGDIVSAGISTYPGIFMVSWNGLGQTEQNQIVINAGANGAIEGWQSNIAHRPHAAGRISIQHLWSQQLPQSLSACLLPRHRSELIAQAQRDPSAQYRRC
jgi:hypothetical protein